MPDEKHLRAREKEREGESVPLLPSPSLAVSHLNHLTFSFERLPHVLEIIKLSYNHIHLPSSLISILQGAILILEF